MKRWIVGLVVLVVMQGADLASGAIAIHSYSDMPTDRVTVFPDSSGYLDRTVLGGYGITKDLWYNAPGEWASRGDSGVSFSGDSNQSSSVAPCGRSLNHAGLRFTFANPVYAFGATEVAVSPANPNSGLSMNLGNTRYELIAYDSAGTVIGDVFWSSYGQIVGPVEYHHTLSGNELMASYAGLWSEVPIYQVTILGARPWDGALTSATASISFSSTPPPPDGQVPEPTTLIIWSLLGGLGMAGGWYRRKPE